MRPVAGGQYALLRRIKRRWTARWRRRQRRWAWPLRCGRLRGCRGICRSKRGRRSAQAGCVRSWRSAAGGVDGPSPRSRSGKTPPQDPAARPRRKTPPQDPAVAAAKADLAAAGETGASGASALGAALPGRDPSGDQTPSGDHSPSVSDLAAAGTAPDAARRGTHSTRHGVWQRRGAGTRADRGGAGRTGPHRAAQGRTGPHRAAQDSTGQRRVRPLSRALGGASADPAASDLPGAR
jgi:hypothetical protein